MATRVRDAIHPVQFGIFPNRFTLPKPSRRDSLWLRGRCLVHTRWIFCMGEGGASFHLETTLGVFKLCKSHLFVRHKTEDTLHPILNIVVTTNVPSRSTEQRRLIIFNWNLGLRRGKEGAIEKPRILDESLLCYSLFWLCCPVQQGHFSLGHQGYLRLPP